MSMRTVRDWRGIKYPLSDFLASINDELALRQHDQTEQLQPVRRLRGTRAGEDQRGL